jgi:uncharacterized protein (TIGR00725 family)
VQRYVAVVGPGNPADPAVLEAARRAGRLLAEVGHVVVTGGLGGVMAAAAEGASAAGGTALGLLPGHDRADAALGNTVVVPTGLGEMRNALLVRTADVVLAVGGSWGTLSEVALALRTGVPVLAVGFWDLTGFPAPEHGDGAIVCADVDEAVARIPEVLP